MVLTHCKENAERDIEKQKAVNLISISRKWSMLGENKGLQTSTEYTLPRTQADGIVLKASIQEQKTMDGELWDLFSVRLQPSIPELFSQKYRSTSFPFGM